MGPGVHDTAFIDGWLLILVSDLRVTTSRTINCIDHQYPGGMDYPNRSLSDGSIMTSLT